MPSFSTAPTQVDAGVDLADALAAHYVGLDAPLVAPDNVLAGQFARTSRGGQKQIEFFGETKIRKRQQVRTNLSYATVLIPNSFLPSEQSVLSLMLGVSIKLFLLLCR
jgi:hypothetical protein